MSALSFTGTPRCAFTLIKNVAVPAAILFRSISMAAARISASGDPINIAFPLSPIHLVTAFNNDWLSHKYRNRSSISVSKRQKKQYQFRPIWAGALFLTFHFALLLFLFSSQVLISCSFVWTVTGHYLALKPIASMHAYLCAHPVIVFSPFQSHLTLVFSSWYSGRFKFISFAERELQLKTFLRLKTN